MIILELFLSIILPLGLSLIFIPVIIRIAHKHSIFDATDFRKTHVGNIPRLGGIGFYSAVILSALIIFIVTKSYICIPFYIAVTLIFISGMIDDFKPVKPIVKLSAQIVAATILILGGHTLSHIYIPFLELNFNFGILRYPLTYIWIIGVTNALNLLDGMDGEAGGVGVIGSGILGIVALTLGQNDIAIISFIFMGSLLGFLNFNLPPAKIFMGDGGSLTTGFFLAAIPLMFSDPMYKGKVLLVGIAILLIPILDVFAAIIRRTRKHISFFEPDRGHIHHKFSDYTSLNTKQILAIIYGFCIVSGSLAIFFLLSTNLYTQLGLLLNLVIHSILFYILHIKKEAGKRS